MTEPDADIDLPEPVGAFVRYLRTRKRSPRTIQSYTEAAGLLAAHADVADLTTVGRDQVEAFILDQLERHSPATAAVRYRSLRALFNWAVEEEYVEVSPMAKMRAPTVADTPVPVLSDDTLRRLLAACTGRTFEDRRDHAMVRLFCEPGGPRLSEMAGLTVDDVDLRRDEVRLHGKGDRIRIIPFGGKTGQALERYRRVRKQHPHGVRCAAFWLTSRGAMTTSAISQMLRRRGAAAGVPGLHPHQLRHTAAHTWMAAGGQETDAMRLFGWRSREMVARYGSSAAHERAVEAARARSLGDRL
jgi:site-specific recombinase XerC